MSKPEMEDMEKSPFYFFYGTHIHIGEGSYINFNCNFIDDGIITIGKRVMFGAAVTIEDNCWIGANVTICPGGGDREKQCNRSGKCRYP